MSDGLRIRAEERSDLVPIRLILDAAFKRPDEGALVDRLRGDGDLTLSLVAERRDPVGHVAFSRLHLQDTPRINACALAPLAVLPEYQRRGIGTALVRDALRRLREDGIDLVLVLGDPAYYGRFGFAEKTARSLTTPYDGPSLQALPLSAGAAEAHGSVAYASAFAGLS